MKRTTVSDIERQYGKPLDQVLTDLYNELGQSKAVAKRLGVNKSTLVNWRLSVRLSTVTVSNFTVLRPSPDYRMES